MDSLISEEDFSYEEELLRDPYSAKKWLQYLFERHQIINSVGIASLLDEATGRNFVYERTLVLLPLSYKLWKLYLDERVERMTRILQLYRDNPEERTPALIAMLATEFSSINDGYERALSNLPYMPRLWLDYASFLMRQRRITAARTTFDRALRALPFSLHERIWTLYLKFAGAIELFVPSTAAEIWSRYWRVAADRSDPKMAARHVGCLLRCQFYDDAASLLVELAQNEPPSLSGEVVDDEEIMPGQYWQELCRIISQHGAAIKTTPVESVLRSAIEKAMERSNFSTLQQRRNMDGPIHATGLFWNALAMWHIRSGRIQEARAVYEQAIVSVPTVRDFSLVFDAFSKMEESIIAIELDRQSRKKTKKAAAQESKGDDLDKRMEQFEVLLERRPFLLSNVRVRQQPNNVSIWTERINLFQERKREGVVDVYEDALKSVHPQRAKGLLSSLWINYARFLEDSEKHKEATEVLRRATEAEFINVEEISSVWIAFGEMMVRQRGIPAALDLLAEALVPPSGKAKDSDNPRRNLFKNLKLWNFYVDLEEARGLLDPTMAAYDRMMDLGIMTPQNVINYAAFLETNAETAHTTRDAAFKVYEKGISAFGYPVSFEIWNIYLPKFVSHYGPKGSIERIRDVFEQSLQGCPASLCSSIYIEYARMEEQYGSARNALKILERAAHAVSEDQRTVLFDLLLSKTQQGLGITAQRSVFEDAIATITGLSESVSMSLRYATLEMSLGEVERARAIYAHASSACDPRRFPALWAAWQEFETRHGTETTFRDMLRVKRAVQAKYASEMSFVPASGSNEAEHAKTEYAKAEYAETE